MKADVFALSNEMWASDCYVVSFLILSCVTGSIYYCTPSHPEYWTEMNTEWNLQPTVSGVSKSPCLIYYSSQLRLAGQKQISPWCSFLSHLAFGLDGTPSVAIFVILLDALGDHFLDCPFSVYVPRAFHIPEPASLTASSSLSLSYFVLFHFVYFIYLYQLRGAWRVKCFLFG